MKYGELTRKLSRLGIDFRRQARGSHEIWWHPKRKLCTVIPNIRARRSRRRRWLGYYGTWGSRKRTLRVFEASRSYAYEQATGWHKQHPEL